MFLSLMKSSFTSGEYNGTVGQISIQDGAKTNLLEPLQYKSYDLPMSKSVLKDVLKDVFDPFCFSVSKKRFYELQTQLKSSQTRLAVPFVFRGEGHYRRIAPMQAHEEISALYGRVCALQPKVVVEIGTCHGGSLYLWCQAASPHACLISLDLPQGRYGGGYHTKREKFYRFFAKEEQKLHLLRGDSHSTESQEKVKSLLGDKQIDFLFIDGDHSYEGVKRDYELYSPLVRSGGLIALHDIAPRQAATGIEVALFWQEIKAKETHTHEFLNTLPNDRTIGIGIVEK